MSLGETLSWRGGKNYLRGSNVRFDAAEPPKLPPFRGYDAEPGLRDFCLAVAQQFESAKEARRAAREGKNLERAMELGRDAARSAYLARVLRDSEPAADRTEPHAAQTAGRVRGAGK